MVGGRCLDLERTQFDAVLLDQVDFEPVRCAVEVEIACPALVEPPFHHVHDDHVLEEPVEVRMRRRLFWGADSVQMCDETRFLTFLMAIIVI